MPAILLNIRTTVHCVLVEYLSVLYFKSFNQLHELHLRYFDHLGYDQQIHPAVPAEDVLWLNEIISRNEQQPLPFHDALLLLRKRLFPFVNDPFPWIEGEYGLRAFIQRDSSYNGCILFHRKKRQPQRY